jgi:hypothetical protein
MAPSIRQPGHHSRWATNRFTSSAAPECANGICRLQSLTCHRARPILPRCRARELKPRRFGGAFLSMAESRRRKAARCAEPRAVFQSPLRALTRALGDNRHEESGGQQEEDHHPAERLPGGGPHHRRARFFVRNPAHAYAESGNSDANLDTA